MDMTNRDNTGIPARIHMRTEATLRAFLAFDGTALPAAYVDSTEASEWPDAWTLIRAYLSGDAPYEAGTVLCLHADADGWRDGVRVTL